MNKNNLITAQQLIDSTDLSFKIKYIAKDRDGLIYGYNRKPAQGLEEWLFNGTGDGVEYGKLKIAEFEVFFINIAAQ